MGSHDETRRIEGLPSQGGNGRPSLMGDLFDRGIMWVCIKKIRTRKTKYIGQSLTEAAHALVPGRCYGIGQNQFEAEKEANREVNKFHFKEG